MNKKVGLIDLSELIANMEPVLNDGSYVFTTVSSLKSIPRSIILGTFKENEGITIILSKFDADRLELKYHYITAWITLNVHSSLEAVGLTATVSNALSKHDINCNIVAGYFHDHIFVSEQHRDRAMEVLKSLSRE